jgi:hypothetical protein
MPNSLLRDGSLGWMLRLYTNANMEAIIGAASEISKGVFSVKRWRIRDNAE